MHAAAIRAQAEAELCALRGWPQVQRCRAGAHVGGPLCHEHPEPHHHLDGVDVAAQLAALSAIAALPRYRGGLRAIPFEVWAARS